MIDLILKFYDNVQRGYRVIHNAPIRDERIFITEDPSITAKREVAIKVLGDNGLLKGGHWEHYPKTLTKPTV